jgi:hypothetical protein
MSLYRINEMDLRDDCKRTIDSLELWMRRLIHLQLSSAYGSGYLDALMPGGNRVVKKEMAKRLADEAATNRKRYPTPLDAAYLDDVIALICNPELFKLHFSHALRQAFPEGRDEAYTFLTRLIPIRNALYHSNAISVHDAHRVLCYSLDVIASLKAYYSAQNMQQQFNAPTILRLTDSLGHAATFSAANRSPDSPGMLDYSRDENSLLYCGDTLSIEVEVDATFDPSTYTVEWTIANVGGAIVQGPKFVLLLEPRYVSARFCAVCRVKSDAAWHRFGTHDDQIDIAYRVLPVT